MIKGKQKPTLSKETILDRISEYDIYRFYNGDFSVNKACINKHRGESSPSLIIFQTETGQLGHKDYGDMSWRGDCFAFVEQIFRCNFFQSLVQVDRDFNLGISNGKAVNRSAVITWTKPEVELKKPPLIQIVYNKRISKEGLDYWARLGQGESDLKRENIFQPKTIYKNRKKMATNELLTFAYLYEDIKRWKIYRPFAPKRLKDTPASRWKWDSNVPFNYVDNVKLIDSQCNKVFMTKSKKDRMVLMTALQTNCIADVQAEDPACLSDEALSKFLSVDARYIVSDNDKKGKEFSWWLTNEHGFKHVNVPDSYLTSNPPCTDFADLCYFHGIQTVINHFKKKKLL